MIFLLFLKFILKAIPRRFRLSFVFGFRFGFGTWFLCVFGFGLWVYKPKDTKKNKYQTRIQTQKPKETKFQTQNLNLG